MSDHAPTVVGRRAVGTITLAAVFAGLLGYVIMWIVFRFRGPSEYAVFAAFWSALYLVVGALAGAQQEFARATTRAPRAEDATPWPGRVLVLGTAGLMAVVAGTAPLWIDSAFPGQGWTILPPLLVGAGAYFLIAVASGMASGVGAWSAVAAVTVIDILLRFAAVTAGTILGVDSVSMAWAVALPLPAALLVATPWLLQALRGRSHRDIGEARLGYNIGLTVAASTATALVVSGLPLLISATSADADPAHLGSVVFTLTLVRAPLIVSLLTLQSLLVVRMRGSADGGRRLIVVIVIGIIATALAGVLIALTIAPWLLNLLVARDLGLSGWFYVELVVSSAFVAALCLTGAALLANGRHVANSLGWALTAVGTIVALALPLPFDVRIALAVLGAPVLGVLTHGVVLVRTLPKPLEVELKE